MQNRYPLQIYPSILSGDFGRLADEAKRIEEAGADAIHVDIMDGHFVPNLTLGPKALAAINRSVDLFLDVHVMIYSPYDYVEDLVSSGADRITFHFEATEDVDETIRFIRKCGIKAGLAFRPETSFSMAAKYFSSCDLILFMTVSPGFGGQKFMPEILEKVRLGRQYCDRHRIRQGGVILEPNIALDQMPPFDIQVDGGVNGSTAKACIDAGANVLVSGDYLFQQASLASGIESLRKNS